MTAVRHAVWLVLVVLVVAACASPAPASSSYYVGFVGDQLTVFKGQKGGRSTVDGTYPLHRGDLSAPWQQRIDGTIPFTSRAPADAWFKTLAANPAAVPGLTTATPSSTP
jgi:hypothetical protein